MMNFNFIHYFWIIVFLSISTTANLRGEKYKTLHIQTNDTIYSSSEGRSIIENYGIKSTNSLRIENGEIAFLYSKISAHTAIGSSAPPGYTGGEKAAIITKIVADYDFIDENKTLTSMNVWTSSTSLFTGYSAISSDMLTNRPLIGPCKIYVYLRPTIRRPDGISSWYGYTGSSDGPFFFHASKGAVTFRVLGSPDSESVSTKKFATVIPENSSGNVNIILEQSTDLINWTAANPGSYPPSTSKRFFRVRAE
jgi:hypothetical protein